MPREALGLIETKGLTAAIVAADAVAKAAAVTVTSVEVIDDACVTVKFEGDLGAVQAAIDAGARAVQRTGELIASHVIPRPDDEIAPLLPNRRFASEYHVEDKRPALGAIPDAPKISRAPSRSITREKTATIKSRVAPQSQKPPRPAPKPHVIPVTPVSVATRAAETAPAPATVSVVPGSSPSSAEIIAMPVVKLRRFARTFANLPIKGRQISMANKDQLLEALRTIIKLD